jgi:hypothetical protein
MNSSNRHDEFDAPDVTHAVMTRLGFEPVAPSVARKSRRRQRMMRGMMFTGALMVVLAAGLHEQISFTGSDLQDSAHRIEVSRIGQAKIFSGLLAPIEELERLLDQTETCESTSFDGPIDPELVHGPSQGGEYIPLLEESSPFTAFPSS